MSKSAPTIAATSTLAMLRTAEARGVPTADLMERAGLTWQLMEDPDARLPAPTVIGLWAELRERAADPGLQLAAPAILPFGAYRVIDYLVAASATVGEGVSRFARFFGLIAEAVSLTVEHSRDEYCLRLARADGSAVPPIYVDYVFAALVTRIRSRIRPALRVSRVELRQPAPAHAAAYGALFCADVVFGAAADRICFSAAEWDSPMDTRDPVLAHLLEEHANVLAQRMPSGAGGFQAEVQRTIAETLPEGSSADAVARALCVSVRTLQRKLVAAGTTFREQSEAVRGRLAEQYLADPTVSIAEVAFMLGFSDQSSFNRTFRRWTGETPGRWRRRRILTA